MHTSLKPLVHFQPFSTCGMPPSFLCEYNLVFIFNGFCLCGAFVSCHMDGYTRDYLHTDSRRRRSITVFRVECSECQLRDEEEENGRMQVKWRRKEVINSIQVSIACDNFSQITLFVSNACLIESSR